MELITNQNTSLYFVSIFARPCKMHKGQFCKSILNTLLNNMTLIFLGKATNFVIPYNSKRKEEWKNSWYFISILRDVPN